MFEKFFKKDNTPQAGNDQEQTAEVVQAAPTSNAIVFLYDQVDRDLWYDLALHINTLVLRLPDVFTWKYYCYLASMTSGENKYEAFLSDLQQAFLFVPCTSATFLTRFLLTRQKDARLTSLLAQTYTRPVPLRAVHGVAQSLIAKPLAAYPSGHERDQACAQVIAVLEQKLPSYQGMRSNTNVEAPLALLTETTNRLMLPAAGYRK